MTDAEIEAIHGAAQDTGATEMTKPEVACDFCHGTKQMNVLNLWRVNRKYQVGGGDIKKALGPTADDLPFIVLDNACHICCGEDASNAAMLALQERMGGNPFNPATYEKEDGQA